MFSENVRAGYIEPLPEWVEHAHIAKYYGIPPWEVATVPYRWVLRTRLLIEAQNRARRMQAAQSPE